MYVYTRPAHLIYPHHMRPLLAATLLTLTLTACSSTDDEPDAAPTETSAPTTEASEPTAEATTEDPDSDVISTCTEVAEDRVQPRNAAIRFSGGPGEEVTEEQAVELIAISTEYACAE